MGNLIKSVLESDHYYMVELFDLVCSAEKTNIWDGTFEKVMRDFFLFVIKHFSREEEFMLMIEYPDYNQHHSDHVKLTGILDIISIRMEKDGPAGFDQERLHMFYKLFNDHIKYGDQKLEDFCRDKNIV